MRFRHFQIKYISGFGPLLFPFKMLRKNDDLVIFTAEDIPALPFGILGKLNVFPFKTSMVVHDLAEFLLVDIPFGKIFIVDLSSSD